jgi:hypothetical protein
VSSRGDGWDDWLGDYRAFDVFERFAEAQRLGLDAATSLMGRFTEMFADARVEDAMDPSKWFGARGDHDQAHTEEARATDPRIDDMRSMRAEAARSMDTVLEMARRLFESTLDMADAAVRRPDLAAWMTDASTEAGLTIEANRGGESAATIWLHHQHEGPVGKVQLSVTPLRDARGDEPEVTWTFEPGVLVDLEPGESRAITLHLSIADSCATGTYWGMVLADGLDDVALPLRIAIDEPDGAG